jgi:ribonuclease HI
MTYKKEMYYNNIMEQTKKFKNIRVFTDGSCKSNGKANAKAGIGIYFPNNEFENVSEAFTQQPITNQRAELYAIYKALNTIINNCKFGKIIIYSDSLYSIKCVTEWAKNWEKKNWDQNIKNLDIIKPLYSLVNKNENKIEFKHVRSHTGKKTYAAKGNEIVDKLACDGTRQERTKS